jgi:hypothetical protein
MGNSVRVSFVNVNELSKDGITCTGGYFALRIATYGTVADITCFNDAEDAKVALYDDIYEIIGANCSDAEIDDIEAVLNTRKQFEFYGEMVKVYGPGVNGLVERAIDIHKSFAHGPEREEAIKKFIDRVNRLDMQEDKEELVEKLEEHGIELRICTECDNVMASGYIIGGGDDYYCSDSCLENNMTREEFNELYGDGDTDTYHTDWWE